MTSRRGWQGALQGAGYSTCMA